MERRLEPELMDDEAQAQAYASLLAAFTLDEVRAQLRAADLAHLDVAQVSERHLVVSGRL